MEAQVQGRAPSILWRAIAPLAAALEGARGHLFPLWVVAFGCGVGLWFGWGAEPAQSHYLAAGALALAGAAAIFAPEPGRAIGALLLALALGFLAAGARGHLQAAPVLEGRYHGPVEGRIVEIDRSASDALRLTLEDVVLEDMAPQHTPARVRVSLRGTQDWLTPAPGQVVILTASLSPPEGPVAPGAFDFRRMAWFQRLGGVGWSATPVLLLDPPGPGEAWIGRLRAHFSAAMRAAIPGEAGAFAAGAMTGDRSGISQATVEALRDSSLAHILAISGMNMAFLSAFVFGLIRGAIACIPWLAVRVNGKKVSAVLSFLVALFYLQLSGANVATERAFLMIAVMLGAVLLDRRAITLRSAAIAGLILLAFRPESLTEPGFQMSFAATVALIWGFEVLDRQVMLARWPRWTVPVFTLVASSFIGGLSTAPYAAAHFNRFADFGLLANLLTVPAMGLLIMPMGVLAFLLAPFGLAWAPLWLMGLGSEWVLVVAYRVAALEGAVTGIPAPGPWALPVLTLGALWLVLWPGRARLAGVAVMLAALALWPAPRPALLISADGRLAGLMGAEGRAVSAPKGGGFAAETWLEDDGDPVAQSTAAARPGFDGPKEARRFTFAGLSGVILSGKRGAALLAEACATADLVILNQKAEVAPEACPLIDTPLLRQTGALALSPGPEGVEVTPTRAQSRLWTGPAMDPEAVAAALPEGLRLAP